MMTEKTVYGVYPHATEKLGEVHETGDSHPHFASGYVVRAVSAGLPYGRMMPLRQYTSHAQAQRFANRLNSK